MFESNSSVHCRGPRFRPGPLGRGSLRRLRNRARLVATGWCFSVAIVTGSISQSHAQQAAAELDPQPAETEAAKVSAPSDNAASLDVGVADAEGQAIEASDEQIAGWVDSLGSRDFAIRERAASQLMAVGGAVLGRLREVAGTHGDPEVRIRAGEIVKQLTRGDLKVRIDAFLAGKQVDFEGWTITQGILGDSAGVRELFVQMLKSHPDLAASMEGTPRDRAMALKKVIAAVEHKIYQQREFPDSADAIALLLPTIDPNVPLDGGFEEILMAVLLKPAGGTLQRDAQLAGPFRALLGRWIPRSSIKNRDEILFYGLSWQMGETGELARRTLGEVQQSETLVYALQAIAQFGGDRDVLLVAKLLDNKRPAAELGFANGKRLRTEVGDVAMATIARLMDVPLQKIGFAKESVDERFAFRADDLGFPVGDEFARAAARKKIDALVNELVDPDPREGL